MLTEWKRAAVAALMLLPASACADGEKAGWDALDLQRSQTAGVTVFCEKSLAEQLDALEPILKEFLAAEAERKRTVRKLLGESDAIIADVNHIIGVKAADSKAAEDQEKCLSFFLQRFSLLDPADGQLTLRIASAETIKDHLRKGGELPGFSYDKATDQAGYELAVRESSSRAPGPKASELAVPVMPGQTVPQAVGAVLASISKVGRATAGMGFHELAEFTIVNLRLRPHDPYFRWFSDGFANVVAAELLGKHVGPEAAKAFLAGQDTAKFADLANQINLRYWTGTDFEIDTPLESEKRLSNARYAFATAEARRLVEKHGIGVLRAILEKASTEAVNDSRRLIAAATEVTGEEIEKRLRQYQSFETPEEGIEKYARLFNAAVDRQDHAAALTDLLRVLELRFPPDPRTYAQAAWQLFRMGHEDAGDRAILKHVDLLKSHQVEEGAAVMEALFVEYAVKCRHFKKAYEQAESVLARKPDFVPALVVRMDRLGASGQIEQARQTARRILELDKGEGSLPRALAEKVLQLEAPPGTQKAP